MNKIFVTSYPYVYERYFRVWDYFPEKEKLVFVLPEAWEAKKGKIKVAPPQRSDLKIHAVKSVFTHSHYPFIRGLLKGWMPSFSSIIKKEAAPGDIIYTAIEPNLLTTLWNSRLAKKRGLKHVFFTWQNIPYKTRLRGAKLRWTEKVIRETIANSVGAICGNRKAAEILREYASAEFKILVAPLSGVDMERFRPRLPSDFREKYSLKEKVVLTFAGVFDERKGLPILLSAFLKAWQVNPALRLVLVGLGPLDSFVRGFIKEKNLEAAVTVIPWLSNEELPGVLANSDIFVYPSQPYGGWEEQFGYSMAEASACGLPVIATRTGSIEEIVLDQKSGWLIEPGTVEPLTEAILKLAEDRHLRGNLGQMGRLHIESNFSHSVIAEKFYHFFNNLFNYGQ